MYDLWHGRQCLDRFPDGRDGGLAVAELLYGLEAAKRRHAGEVVPHLDVAVARPVGGEFRKLFLAAEWPVLGGDRRLRQLRR